MNQFDELKKMTTIVADTGEIEEIKKHHPTDATTNPSLILAASAKPEYQFLIEEALSFGRKKGKNRREQLSHAFDKVCVNFGLEILKIVPGRVSTEVDARLSFDTIGSVQKARELISLYEAAGIDRKRILIKLASTWAGAQAAFHLEKEGIHCNMTLMFGLAQAIACADVHATLISPFVGRILDWHKKNEGKEFPGAEDPGVRSVTQIYHYYKKFGIKTQIMGASFRNKDEITELAGCDLLTISPKLLDELRASELPITRKLDPSLSHKMEITPLKVDEKTFYWMMCENAMAGEKLSEGIRNFAKDVARLEELLSSRL